MNEDIIEYIKMFDNLTLFEQIHEIKINPSKAHYAIEFMYIRLLRLSCMAMSAGTPEFKIYSKDYDNYCNIVY